MPITLTFPGIPPHGWNGKPGAANGLEFFGQTNFGDTVETTEIINSTFDNVDFEARRLIGWKHGFLEALYNAYCNHHQLTIRPEDIWFSILSQLNLYVNAHPQESRHLFVRPSQRMPPIHPESTVSALANYMEAALAHHVNDPEVRAWALPSFSTTTEDDAVTASTLVMGAITQCFQFPCPYIWPRGIQSLTLLGERTDWEALLTRLEMIETWGEQPRRFATNLRPVLRRFVTSFDGNLRKCHYFWNWCFREKREAGMTMIVAGWATAFCFWDVDGECIPPVINPEERVVEFDGVSYPPLQMSTFPGSYATFKTFCIDEEGIRRRVRFVAGLVGFEVLYHPDGFDGGWTELQPVSGWWVI
ncbi:hypothetical protein BO94DRAFT_478371 [Aspergillus sclerotioniger CBS 115572]|uniref:Uncharacterized protein n=1 Tax=Aspergillus sclerotioniger CBS 115572 TaxID=1450535 RepID=A0A317V6F2_9EURO|nr:hypothetical protein BO94DRAFT_478371 [Aspergillus sclerotioniger CBS 115572]PWY68517.1 hypothetical protein BO94DRAFT_478371 [Aspergillus sclerotioniger CBS 115572]